MPPGQWPVSLLDIVFRSQSTLSSESLLRVGSRLPRYTKIDRLNGSCRAHTGRSMTFPRSAFPWVNVKFERLPTASSNPPRFVNRYSIPGRVPVSFRSAEILRGLPHRKHAPRLPMRHNPTSSSHSGYFAGSRTPNSQAGFVTGESCRSSA